MALLVLAAIGPVPLAIAQTGTTGGSSGSGYQEVGKLQEITVTAEKRKESLLDVPVTVAVVGSAALQNNDASDLSKIGELVPQVSIGAVASGTGALISIRGISSTPSDAGIDQSVSVVLDGVQVDRGQIISQSMFDTRQVQVLEGPQALFFGKNSPAGVIDVQSNGPTPYLEGYVHAGYEFDASQRYVEGAISGPLSDTFKARLAFRASDMSGWMRNVAQPQPDPFVPGVTLPGAWDPSMPSDRSYAGRLIAQWTPTEDFTATARITIGTDRTNGMAANVEKYCTHGTTIPTILGFNDTQADCQANQRMAESALPAVFAVNYPYANNGVPYSTSTDTLASVTLAETLRGVTVTSITGYYGQRFAGSENADFSSFAQVYDAQFERYGMVSEELRAVSDLSGVLNYTAGLYVDHSTRYHFNAPFLLDVGVNPATGNYTALEQDAWNGENSYSAFGQLRWKILPSLELSGGARWTYESKSLAIGNSAVNPAYAALWTAAGSWIKDHYGDHNISPEVTLSWHPWHEATLYASYKTGYKSGGFSNTAVLDVGYTASTLRFRPEKTHGEEIGFKSELLHQTMRLTLTAYRYRYNGLQVTAYDPTTVSYTVRNASDARTQGVEGSLEWLLGHGLTLHGAFGFNHARYLDFPGAQCYATQSRADGCVNGQQNLAGKPLVVAPDWAYNLGESYAFRLPWGLTGALDVSGAYSGSYYLDDTEDPNEIQHAFWRLNASLRVSSPDDTWSVSVIGRDLNNAYYAVDSSAVTFGGPYQYDGYFNRPREVILQAGYHF